MRAFLYGLSILEESGRVGELVDIPHRIVYGWLGL